MKLLFISIPAFLVSNTITSFHLPQISKTNHKSFSFSFSSTSNNNNEVEVPRLNADKVGLVRWIEESGGSFTPEIKSDYHGWCLYNTKNINEGEILAVIPKSICIASSTKTSTQPTSPLLESAQSLINSLDPSFWRARLAIAVLSERVRPGSPFRYYIRNLPHEFRVST